MATTGHRATGPGGLGLAFGGLDALARLSLPASLFLLVAGAREAALVAGVLATVASLLRGVVAGLAVEEALVAVWRRVVRAARRREATELAARSHGDEGVAMLLEIMEQEAVYRGNALPRIGSLAVSAVLVTGAIVHVLGARWILAGAVVVAFLGGLVALGHRRVAAAYRGMMNTYGPLSVDLGIMLDAALELRAQAAEEFVAERVLVGSRDLAHQRRVASTWSTLLSLLPMAVAALSLTGPAQVGIEWVRLTVEAQAPEAGILGATAAVVGVGLAHAFQDVMASRPGRERLADFLKGHDEGAEPGTASEGEADVSLLDATITVAGVSHRYPDSDVETPGSLAFEWRPKSGIAIVGPNGSGKSTLMLVLAGLLAPTRGRASLGERDLLALDAGLRRKLAYIPQRPFVAPDRSVAWHFALTGHAPTRAQMLEALRKVDLLAALEEHARKADKDPLAVLVSELSGGERSRLAIARALARDASILLLDEPESGLDAAGRRMLRELLDELCRERRVAVVAHDESVVPETFARVACERRLLAADQAA